jgi:hypothetical protein
MAKEINLQQEELQILKNLAKAFAAIGEAEGETKEDHTKTPAGFTTATRLHGSGGIFAGPGLEPDVISAHVRPHGLAGQVPLVPSVSEDPRFASLTGFTDDVGSEATNACDDAPTGYVKGCNLTARFGMLRRDTNTIEMNDVMRKVNRGDFTDLMLRGRLLGLTDLEPSGMNEQLVLNIMTMAEMVSVAVRTEREFTRQFWQGVTTVANEFPGLDVQIATGQKDADTGDLCAALDSDVKNYNYQALGPQIVNYLSQLEWYLKYNAMTMGLDPVQWVIVMRPDLWYELTAVWPCSYNTAKCSPAVDTNSTVYIDGRENVADRDAMRNGMYIDINGSRYPVVVDTGIFEHNNINNGNLGLGQYASSIYMVPLTIQGGFPVTYREYLDYRQAMPDVRLLRGLEEFFWTDAGVYTWAVEQVKWCYKLALKSEQRVILRTPQLAGRIDAVMYEPLQHLRDSNPDSPYWYDGGVSTRAPIQEPYATWTSRA